MRAPLNRQSLQELARIRLREAKVLLKGGYYDGAYYLCGYVIECALKACIARHTKRYDFPEKKTVIESYTHDLEKLVKVAEMWPALDEEMDRDPDFADNWDVVKDWHENSRYERHLKREAEDLYASVVDRQHGVLRWIRQHW